MRSRYELFQSQKDNQYYWHLRAANNEIILQSEGYTTKQAAENGIDSAKENSPFDERYKRLDARNGEYYFTLTAKNNKIIGVSETYKTKQGRDKGIEAVKREGPNAPVKDLTDEAQNRKDIANTISDAEKSGSLFISPKKKPTKGLVVKPKGGVYGKS